MSVSQLRETCRGLLEEGTVQVVIGYAENGNPLFVTRVEDVERLAWNERSLANLTVYLKRKEVQALGNIALVVKGCDERALVVLEQESQLDRDKLHIIGMACDGMGQPKCAGCEVRTPRFANRVIGAPSGTAAGAEDGALEALMRLSPAERFAFWKAEFARCVKCYACRQVCPLCYCPRCVADKNRPTTIDTSPSLKGNFAWHITRAFHLAGRCVGCDECTRACPAGIDLRLLNRSLAMAAKAQFDYRAGMDPQQPPVIGSYSVQDKESFIR